MYPPSVLYAYSDFFFLSFDETKFQVCSLVLKYSNQPQGGRVCFIKVWILWLIIFWLLLFIQRLMQMYIVLFLKKNPRFSLLWRHLTDCKRNYNTVWHFLPDRLVKFLNGLYINEWTLYREHNRHMIRNVDHSIVKLLWKADKGRNIHYTNFVLFSYFISLGM